MRLEVIMEKTVVELFAGVGGFRCGLNNVTLINDKDFNQTGTYTSPLQKQV